MDANDKHVLSLNGSSIYYGTKGECENKLREISPLSVNDALDSGEFDIRKLRGARGHERKKEN